MWVLSSAAPANCLHKRHIISWFAVNRIKQQLASWRNMPFALQKFCCPNNLSCVISKRSFLAVTKTVELGLSQVTNK